MLKNGGAGLEGGFVGGFGEAIPRAGVKAVVAAVDATSEGATEFERDCAFAFDGEVGETAACIHPAGGGDGLSWAGGDAAGTGAAVVRRARVGVDVEGGDDLGEEEPGAELTMNLHGAFAIPAKAGLAGKIAFENGAGVDVMALASA